MKTVVGVIKIKDTIPTLYEIRVDGELVSFYAIGNNLDAIPHAQSYFNKQLANYELKGCEVKRLVIGK